MLISSSLGDWKAEHSAVIRTEVGHLMLNDAGPHDWHIIRIARATVAGRRLTVKAVIEPLPGCNADFYVAHWGGYDMAMIARDGSIVKQSDGVDLAVERNGPRLSVSVTFDNVHATLNLGTAKNGDGRYLGDGRDQFAFHEIVVTGDHIIPNPGALKLLDVGAMGGLADKWLPHIRNVHPVFVEPLPGQAKLLREMYPNFTVVEAALSNVTGRATLNATWGRGCSSLRVVNHDFMKRYASYPLFVPNEAIPTQVHRYDDLVASGLAPLVDIIKIDTQGTEYEVLEGMAKTLETAIGIELETHFYPVYAGQKLIGDVVAFLADRGFHLRRIEPQMSFDADVVECDAFFTRDLSPDHETQHRLLEQVWQLTRTDAGAKLVEFVRRRNEEAKMIP